MLRQYLAPLPPYGPDGEGWPLGRRVHGPELEAAALQVEGVEFLEGLNVAGLDAADADVGRGLGRARDRARCPSSPRSPSLERRTAGARGRRSGRRPANVPVPIPIIRKEC